MPTPTYPCYDCPFLNGGSTTWGGHRTPENYALIASRGIIEPCHIRVKSYDTASPCVGMMIFQKNIGAEAVDAKELNERKVFSTREDFIKHHQEVREALVK